MSKTKNYTNAPINIAKEIDDSIPVEDFLPSPQEIVEMLSKEETIPVTMKLKKKTVERYKRFAQEKGVKYQTFVSSVLDSYAQRL
ncbi:MAG: CopG family transcriptional regulator [Dehalococcoidia bacterium]